MQLETRASGLLVAIEKKTAKPKPQAELRLWECTRLEEVGRFLEFLEKKHGRLLAVLNDLPIAMRSRFVVVYEHVGQLDIEVKT